MNYLMIILDRKQEKYVKELCEKFYYIKNKSCAVEVKRIPDWCM